MSEIAENQVTNSKQEICIQVQKMVGYNVVGLSDLLSILTHPEVLPLLEDLIDAVKETDG